MAMTDSVAVQADNGDRPGRYPLILMALMLAEITCSLESNMIFVALSKLYQQFGSPVTVNWVITAFMLTSCASAVVIGRLGDMFGRKHMMMLMLAIAGTGSALSASAHGLPLLIVGRAMQGASMAILPLCYGILREHCSPSEVTRGTALLGAVYVFGAGAGTLLGGLIVDLLSWQWIFIVSGGFAAAALGLVMACVPVGQTGTSSSRLDIPGMVGFLISAPTILLALSWYSFRPDDSPLIPVALAGVGLCVGVWWARAELRHDAPFIDLKLLRRRPILFPNLCILLAAFGPIMHPIVMIPFLQQPAWSGTGLGLSGSEIGLIKIPSTGIQVLILIGCGYLASRFGTRSIVSAVIAFAMFAWALLAISHSSLVLVLLVFVFVIGPAAAVLFALIPRLIMESVPQERTSEATGLTQSIRALGQAVGSQIIAAVLASEMVYSADTKAGLPADAAYSSVFLMNAVLSLAALLALSAVAKFRTR